MTAVGQYDPKLGRDRTHSDDFYDHRKLVQERITDALRREKEGKK
ncbi:hypothetical protein B7L88_gp147 [Rhizobium phage RHEph10]|nr:hypothetical protein B7L88_gp147 [Rhizobium phage RHEph10]AGC36141.1 hypothetical protein RHEph10_gp098 [Rhizobium phage RHEph10]